MNRDDKQSGKKISKSTIQPPSQERRELIDPGLENVEAGPKSPYGR